MKIAIVAPSGVPYAVGGAEKLWWGMLNAFRRFSDHEVELIKLPAPERNFAEVIASYRQFSELNLDHFDRVISTKYPAWMVRHDNHHVYLQHTLRGLYDTYPEHLSKDIQDWPEPLARLRELLGEPPSPDLRAAVFDEIEQAQCHGDWQHWFAFPGPLSRAVIHWLDRSALQPGLINKFMAISHNVAGREGYFPAYVPVQVIHHPSDLVAVNPQSGDYLFTASRLDSPKRIDLLIRAVRQVEGDMQLRIAGAGPDEDRLRQIAGDDERIQFLGRITDDEIARQYAGALAVGFVPADEDYGLITLEALQAGKPVISCTDSGGVEELIADGETGWLCAPEPADLAQRLQWLYSDPDQARQMERACLERGRQVNWRDTLNRLLDGHNALDNDGYLQRGKPKKIVVAVSFPIHPARSGGQNRVYHLYRHIAYFTPVTLVTLCSHSMARTEVEIAPGLTEIRIPKSATHERAEAALERELGVSVGDLYAMAHIEQTPEYLEALKAACLDADLAIASHCYLYPAIRAVYRGPVIYEAHNVELDMKTALLGQSELATHWLEQARTVEQACIDDSVWLAACSAGDLQRFEALYGVRPEKCGEAPNGVNICTEPLSPHNKRRLRRRLSLGERPIALFMGSWHGPNIAAARYIVDTLAPALPGLNFWLIGTVCREFQSAATPVNTRLWGEISEADKWQLLQVADLALNPVDSGGGSNLKMAEYAAALLPIVSTPHGARGLAFNPQKHLLLADLDYFEKKLHELVNQLDSAALEHMSAEARAVSVDRHDWRGIARGFYRDIVTLCAI